MQQDKYIISYARLSKDDPFTDESSSIHYQRMLIDKYIQEHFQMQNYECMEFYDDGYSGTNLERPGIKKVLELVREGKVHCIIVKDISRFSRDFIDIGKYIERVFPFMDVRFISIADDYDSQNYLGKPLELDMKFKSILADYYCKDTSDKIINQLSAKKSQGKFIAGSTPFGYSKSEEDKYKLVIEPEEAAVVKMIFEKALAGMKIAEIARLLDDEGIPTPLEYEKMKRNINREAAVGKYVWSARSVHNILTNEAYIGTMTYDKYRQKAVGSKKKELLPSSEWKRIYNHHEPIVTADDFETIRQRYSNNLRMQSREKQSSRNEIFPLSGKLFCGGCKKALSVVKGDKVSHSVYCQTAKITDELECFNDSCVYEEISDVVLYHIRKHVKERLEISLLSEKDIELQQKKIQSNTERISEAQECLTECDDTLQELLVKMHRREISTTSFMESKTLLDVERNAIIQDMKELESEVKTSRSAIELSQSKRNDIDALGSLERMDSKLVEKFIDKVFLYNGSRIHIVCKEL